MTILISAISRNLQSSIGELRKSSLGQRLARGAFWSFVGTVIARGLGLLSSMITARLLGIKGFGEFGVIQVTVGMFGIFAGFGLGLTATKYVAEYRNTDKVKTGRIIALSNLVAVSSAIFICIILYLIAPILASKTLSASHLAPLLQMGAGILFFSALNGAQTGALAGFEAFKAIARINVISGILSLPIMIGGTYLGGITGAVCASVFSLGVNWALNKHALKKVVHEAKLNVLYNRCWKEWKVLRDFSFPAFLSNVVTAPLGWAFSAILTYQPNGYSEMGIFNAATQWRTVLAFLPSMITSALLPILSDQNNTNVEGFNSAINLTHKLIFIVIFPITLVLMISSGMIMKFYGQGFSVGKNALVYTLAATTISCIGSPAGTAIQAKGRMWLGCLMNLSYAIVCLGLCYFLAPLSGATGACLSVFIAYIFLTLWSYLYLYKMLNRRMVIRTFAGILSTILITLIVVTT